MLFDLSASWSVGELVVGELVCRRVVQLPYFQCGAHWNNIIFAVCHFFAKKRTNYRPTN